MFAFVPRDIVFERVLVPTTPPVLFLRHGESSKLLDAIVPRKRRGLCMPDVPENKVECDFMIKNVGTLCMLKGEIP